MTHKQNKTITKNSYSDDKKKNSKTLTVSYAMKEIVSKPIYPMLPHYLTTKNVMNGRVCIKHTKQFNKEA